jgi:hypothetical protein
MYGMTTILGLGLVAAPFVFGYTANPAALWTSIILGVAVVAVSGIKAMLRDKGDWEYYANVALGLAAIVSPFIFSFRSLTPAFWSELVLGAATVMLAGYKVFEDSMEQRPGSHAQA